MSRNGQANPRTHLYERAPRPLVGYAYDYPAGFRTGRHSHPRAQLLYATHGVMRIETDEASYTIPPGRGLFMPADVPHAVRMDGQVSMRALFLRADAARAGPGRITVIAVSPLLRELILAACAEPVVWDRKGRVRHLVALALDEISRAATPTLSLPVPRDPRLRRVTESLRENPADPRDLADFALDAGASTRTLARLFHKETGMGFAQWRRQLRLTEALALLAAGDSPARAAAAVGYASGPAFGAAFRVAFGLTPGQVRPER
jgi:AraC-like DNA-binding protein